MPKGIKKGFAPKAEMDTGPARRTLTLKLGENGEPLWEKFTEPTIEAWKKILAHPATEKVLPRATAANSGETGSVHPPPSEPSVSPELVSAGLDILGKFEGLVFARIYRLPEAAQIFTFSMQEKAALVPPAQKVIGKYSPAVFERYGDEIALGLIMLNLTAQKVRLCRQLAAAKREAEQKAKEEKTAAEKTQDEAAPGWTEDVSAAVTQ